MYELVEILVLFFVAVVFVSAVRPIVNFLARYRIPPIFAIIVIYTVTAAAVVGLLVVALPPLATLMVNLFAEDQLVEELNRSFLQLGLLVARQFDMVLPILTLPPSFQEYLSGANEAVMEQALPFARSAFYVGGQLLLALIMSVYWLVAREQFLSLILRMTPRQNRHNTYLLWVDIENTLGGFVRGQIALMVLIGMASYIGLLILRVPNALALAIIAGLLEAVPYVGPFLGAIPAVLVGFSAAPLTGVLVIVWYVIVQQVEGAFLVPRVMSHSVGLNPLLILLVLSAGFTLNGVLGALLAIPIASVLQVALYHLWPEMELGNSAAEKRTESRKQDARETSAELEAIDALDPASADATPTESDSSLRTANE